jgi:hypothetical protein
MTEFNILKENIHETEHYIMHVGTIPGDQVPQYLVFNKNYDVLEYGHNVLPIALEGIRDLETKLQNVTNEKVPSPKKKFDVFN